jgi:hypothetical protein
MASPRSTPFIASWESDELLDATAPLDECSSRIEARLATERVARSVAGPSRLAWYVVGFAGVLAAGALIWTTEGTQSRDTAIIRPARTPPPPVRAELQAITARIDMTPPDIALADEVEPSFAPRSQLPQPRPARTVVRPRDELAAALLERRKQLSQMGIAGANVDAVAGISFDPSRRSARVVYQAEDSAAQVVEYWALRDGRWQPIND